MSRQYAWAYPARARQDFYVEPQPAGLRELRFIKVQPREPVDTPEVRAAAETYNAVVEAAYAEVTAAHAAEIEQYRARAAARERKRCIDESAWLQTAFGITDCSCPLFQAIYARAHKMAARAKQHPVDLLASLLTDLYTPEIRAWLRPKDDEVLARYRNAPYTCPYCNEGNVHHDGEHTADDTKFTERYALVSLHRHD